MPDVGRQKIQQKVNVTSIASSFCSDAAMLCIRQIDTINGWAILDAHCAVD